MPENHETPEITIEESKSKKFRLTRNAKIYVASATLTVANGAIIFYAYKTAKMNLEVVKLAAANAQEATE